MVWIKGLGSGVRDYGLRLMAQGHGFERSSVGVHSAEI
jgi:hypothetical protein